MHETFIYALALFLIVLLVVSTLNLFLYALHLQPNHVNYKHLHGFFVLFYFGARLYNTLITM